MSRVVQQGRRIAAITPSDTVDVPDSTNERPALVYVGTGGDLKVTAVGGGTEEFRNIPDGSILPVQVLRVFATGQTGAIATDLVAIFDS